MEEFSTPFVKRGEAMRGYTSLKKPRSSHRKSDLSDSQVKGVIDVTPLF
jgi:hypothetical protein